MIYVYLFLAGILGGFLGGLLGIGGGTIFVLILPTALVNMGVPTSELAQYIVANSLFATLFSTLSANFMQIRSNNFHLKPILWVGIVSTIVSWLVLYFVVHSEWYSYTIFNIFVIAVMLFMVVRILYSTKSTLQQTVKPIDELPMSSYILTGVSVGVIAPLSGLGGGVVVVPILGAMYGISVHVAIAIGMGVVTFNSFTSTFFNLFEKPIFQTDFYQIGYIIFPIVLSLSAGVVIAAPLGVMVGKKTGSKKIKWILALFLTIVIIEKTIRLFV